MKLGETIDGMLSSNWYERLEAEFNQINIRIDELIKYISHYRKDMPKVEVYLMEEQLNKMIEYRNILEMRISLYEHDGRLAKWGNKVRYEGNHVV